MNLHFGWYKMKRKSVERRLIAYSLWIDVVMAGKVSVVKDGKVRLCRTHPDRWNSFMNSFPKDILEKIAQSSRLAQSVSMSREIQSAGSLLLPDELAKLTISEGTKAVAEYPDSK